MRTGNGSRRILGAVGLVAALAWTPFRVESQEVPDAPGNCRSLCDYTCQFDLMIVTNGRPYNDSQTPDFYCKYGLCHGCGLATATRALVPDLVAAVRAGDMDQVAAVVASSPAVTLNADRQAIQVAGCAGSVVANVPVPAAQFAMLERDLGSRGIDMVARVRLNLDVIETALTTVLFR